MPKVCIRYQPKEYTDLFTLCENRVICKSVNHFLVVFVITLPAIRMVSLYITPTRVSSSSSRAFPWRRRVGLTSRAKRSADPSLECGPKSGETIKSHKDKDRKASKNNSIMQMNRFRGGSPKQNHWGETRQVSLHQMQCSNPIPSSICAT